jgi:16S rRNA (guanine(527)-N(7))-methyltransferase RsmG
MDQDQLLRLLEQGGEKINPDALAGIHAHHELLLTWNRTAHLVSAGDASLDALGRHDIEALQALPHLGDDQVVDVGTGGGYPGLIWACCRPDLQITLVEANQRKVAFLREVKAKLGLTQVKIAAQRLAHADELAGLGGTVWTSRAAGCTDLLLEAGVQLPAGGVTLLLYVGEEQARSLASVQDAGWACRSDEALNSGVAGRLVVLQRA